VNLFGGGEVLHLCELAALKHPLPKVRFWAVAQRRLLAHRFAWTRRR
jgi:hypothetical protein